MSSLRRGGRARRTGLPAVAGAGLVRETAGRYGAGALQYRVVMYRGEDGQYVVECPALPGCVSQGRTPEAARANIREAIELCLETYAADGERIPGDVEIVVETVEIAPASA